MLHLLQTIRQRNRASVPRGREKLARDLSVMKSPLDGLGCFATARFPKNSPIAEYAGERITQREAMRRLRGPGGKRISELDADCYIDGSVDGNDTQYINHSCEPNADAFIIDGLMIVFALHEILPGEEITVDYLNSFEEDRTVCQCRAASCRQRIDQQAA
jgi:SET domain-containing protein